MTEDLWKGQGSLIPNRKMCFPSDCNTKLQLGELHHVFYMV